MDSQNDRRMRSKVLAGGFEYSFAFMIYVCQPMNVTEDAFGLVYANGAVKICQIAL